MRRIVEDRSRTFGPVKLYREEIDEILSIVTEACGKVELSDDKNIYDSISEMEDRVGNRFHYLQIKGSSPYANITLGTKPMSKWFRRDDNHVYIGEGVSGELLFSRVQGVVSHHERRLQYFFNFPILLLVIAIDVLSTWLRHSHPLLTPGASNVLEFIYSCYFLAFTYFNVRGKSHISLVSWNKRQTFVERNRDNLLMVAIGAVIGIVTTLVAEWLKSTFFPK